MRNTAVERPRKIVRRVHKWDDATFKPIDWKKEHSYTNVKLFFEISARTSGKTFGLRLENIENYWKHRTRFVEIVRNKTELPAFERGYFEKIALQREFPEMQYKVENDIAYIAKIPPEDEDTEWEACGYFVALSAEQDLKRYSFSQVRDFTYDEAVLDRTKNTRKRYLKDEYGLIMGIMNTALREVPGSPVRSRLHLLGNACDITCPLFQSAGVGKIPPIGRSFYGRNKICMVNRHPAKYSKQFREQTTVGQLMGLSEEAECDSGIFFDNEFNVGDVLAIARKPKTARHMYTIRFGRIFSVWYDFESGLVFVNDKAPNDGKPVFAMLRQDATIDYKILRRSSDLIKTLSNFARAGLLRYENPVMAARFGEFLEYVGVR